MEHSNTNISSTIISNEDDTLVDLMELLEEIDENKPSAKANEVSMTDREGRRIYY